MSNDADKAQTPAQDPELARLRQELEVSNRNYANLRSAYNQRDAEAQEAKRILAQRTQSATQEDPGEPAPQPSNGHSPRYTDEDFERMAFRQAKIEFLAMNPGAHEEWAKINAVILDPAKAPEYAAWDAQGRVNYERVIKDIHRDLKWQEIEAARKAAAASPAPALAAAQPTGTLISGAHTSSPGPGGGMVNYDRMKPEEIQQDMISTGKIEIDANDPPRARVYQKQIP